MATMLNSKLVELTAGVVKFKKLIWKGSRRKALDTPAIDVKKETTKAIRGGRNTRVLTPETEKYTVN